MSGSVYGYVVSAEDAAPIARALIEVVGGPRPLRDNSTRTDGDGAFQFARLDEGEWQIAATTPTGRSNRASVHVFEDAVSDVTIEIAGRVPRNPEEPMTGRIRGRVVRMEDNTPVEEASISVVRGAGPAPDIAPLTDDDGWFEFDGLPEGQWVLRAIGPDGETGEGKIRVHAGGVVKLTIRLRGGGGVIEPAVD